MSRQQHRLAHVLTGTVPRGPMAAADATAAAAARVPRRVGLLGLGAIGEVVAKALLRQPGAVGCPPQGESPEPAGVEGAALCAILVSDTAKHAGKPWLPAGVVLTADPEAFFAAAPEVIVEAAGQPTVRSFGERALLAGCDFIVTSTGALTDDALHERLSSAASGAASGRLHLASGAMPGLDWMQAAAMGGGVSRVTVVQSKPPVSWHGTAAEAAVLAVEDWASHGPLTIFEGSARAAVSRLARYIYHNWLRPRSHSPHAALRVAAAHLLALHDNWCRRRPSRARPTSRQPSRWPRSASTPQAYLSSVEGHLDLSLIGSI